MSLSIEDVHRIALLARLDAGGTARSVLPWLLSWGPQVQVIGPDGVRAAWQRLTREAAEVAARTPTRFVQHGAA